MSKIIRFLYIILLIGCTGKKELSSDISHGTNIPLELQSSETIKSNSNIFKLVHKIDLETNNECLITQIKSICANDSLIVVIDDNDPLPMVFNYDGRFIRKIGKEGRGPGEIETNRHTIIDDSSIMVLTEPSCVINQYSFNNDLIQCYNLTEDGYLAMMFHQFETNLYFFCWAKNTQNSILGKLDLSSNRYTSLWSVKTAEEENTLYNHKFRLFKPLAAFHKNSAFLCLSNQYKIHVWDNDVYQGYYTNDYHKYKFYENNSITKELSFEEFSKTKHHSEYKKSDYIHRIFFLGDQFLLVDIISFDDAGGYMTLINNKKYRIRYSGYNDLIDLKNKRIYSGIPRDILFFSGSYKDQILSWDPPDPAIEELRNPSIVFYRLDTTRLNQ